MIEGLLVLMLVIAGCWLLVAALWFVFKLCFWLAALTVGAVGGALLMTLLLPLALLLGLVLLPVLILSLLPALLPLLLFGGLIWLLVRDRPQPRMLR
ncbi:MAG: hypothetical protein NVS9B10_16560 [Nevskia sp.]